MLTPGQQRKGRRQRENAAEALYHAEVRAYIAKRASQGAPPALIAEELSWTKARVREAFDISLQALRDQDHAHYGERFPDDEPMPTPPPGTPRRMLPPPSGKNVYTGEVIENPDERAFIHQAFALRKRQLPYDEIAQLTGRTEQECRDAVVTRLRELQHDELADTNTARRMMLEQIDAMIAAITVPATGRDIDGKPAPVVLDAIDRMVKLMDRKAKLLGLDAPQKVDLNHRIAVLSEESGYDLQELQGILKDVLSEYKPPQLR